jgi:hypothetical protein
MVHVFEDLMPLLAVFFAWEQYRLRKSQEILMALQTREIQERFDRLEKIRQKQTETEEKSLITRPWQGSYFSGLSRLFQTLLFLLCQVATSNPRIVSNFHSNDGFTSNAESIICGW